MLLGVTGSIAAYKAVEVARRLGKANVGVQVAMTHSATRFVSPITFEAVTGQSVLDDPWVRRGGEIQHVERAHEVDLLLIAPASAHTLARLAHGFADDPIAATALSTQAPIVVAPAMEDGMWNHPATQTNLQTLVRRGVQVIGPESGDLASGRSGQGRMSEPETVVSAVLARLRPGDLEGLSVVVTAGPTWEPIDPVRVLSNRSTGAMGIAIAEAGAERGAEVLLVLGPTHLRPAPHPRLSVASVETAEEMLAAARKDIGQRSVVVGAAAVSDFRPAQARTSKLKKSEGSAKALDLVENPDVLATLSKLLRAAKNDPTVVGFAAETDNMLVHAQGKLRSKRCDLVVANTVGKSQGFGPGETEIHIVREVGDAVRFGPASKRAVAGFIWDQVLAVRGGAQ